MEAPFLELESRILKKALTLVTAEGAEHEYHYTVTLLVTSCRDATRGVGTPIPLSASSSNLKRLPPTMHLPDMTVSIAVG